ncbi:uncharacterized protein LY89DRAFT_720253 [Mollisia scopiformis]|uniref:NYN domain-containing protein n=1 Tax=Mollisia scopiformis TaxID=149040 RepID=A0A194X4N5_MOLSC|nr:uncharacterized protein LY89DRAFT_720253 [Mollisia scopiformis]KUJ14782.1 hypothetical protein LY89DRAFT_720253 [Mollisia scopiformis]
MDESDDNRESPWDFTAARQFMHAFNSYPPEDAFQDDSIPEFKLYNPKLQAPKALGDFDRLFTFFGQPPLTIAPRRRSNDSSSAKNEDTSTPPSSAPDDDSEDFEHFVHKAKEVRWTDQEGTAELAEFRRRSTRGSTTEDLDASVIAQLLEATDPSGLESDDEDESTLKSRHSSQARAQKTRFGVNVLSVSKERDKGKHQEQVQTFSPSASSFLPASITPPKPFGALPPPPRITPNNFVDPLIIKPYHTLTVNEQKVKLVKRLARRFLQEAKLLKTPEAIINNGGNIHPKGVHVFVDLSNIVIGFYERIKINRVHAGRLHPNAYTKQPPFSFHSLTLILERGRAVGRRVMVGSTSNLIYDPNGHKLPDHILEAERLGYEPNILERVAKPLRAAPPRRRGGSGSGYATSGHSSASESQFAGRFKMKEQAVDELLQMKMLESLLDFEPSTIVLASGDAAEAEYSGGFLKSVERALERGWKVEVMAWSKGLSYEYRSRDLLKKWEGKLSIIELDEFCEEMLAIYAQKWVIV